MKARWVDMETQVIKYNSFKKLSSLVKIHNAIAICLLFWHHVRDPGTEKDSLIQRFYFIGTLDQW